MSRFSSGGLVVVQAMTALVLAVAPGCIAEQRINGTGVIDTRLNRDVMEVCEKYRHAIEDRDAETLLSMASPAYFEDSGTPKGEDDYGYEGLRQVLNTRLSALKSIRYNIDYRTIEVRGNRAHVDLRYDASFQLATELGD